MLGMLGSKMEEMEGHMDKLDRLTERLKIKEKEQIEKEKRN